MVSDVASIFMPNCYPLRYGFGKIVWKHDFTYD